MANNFINSREINNSQTRAAMIRRAERLNTALPAMYNSLLHTYSTANTNVSRADLAERQPNPNTASTVPAQTANAVAYSASPLTAEATAAVSEAYEEPEDTSTATALVQPETNMVVQSSSEELERDQMIARSLDEIYAIHSNYVPEADK
jgi:hypothetical protein